jgi:hypothetical protein
MYLNRKRKEPNLVVLNSHIDIRPMQEKERDTKEKVLRKTQARHENISVFSFLLRRHCVFVRMICFPRTKVFGCSAFFYPPPPSSFFFRFSFPAVAAPVPATVCWDSSSLGDGVSRKCKKNSLLRWTVMQTTMTVRTAHFLTRVQQQRRCSQLHYRCFLISVAHPSMPSPFVPGSISSLTPSIPFVPSRKPWPAMPPALARSAGRSSSMGNRNSAMRLASSMLKWYFSLNTSGRAQWRRRWMLRNSPLRLNISCDHLPPTHKDFGKVPRSSMT